jgi:zinc protease
MTKLNRKIPPQAKPVEYIKFPEVETFHLQNGIPVYCINAGEQEIIKIDLIMEAGQWFSDNPLTAQLCNRLLIEGSSKYSHAEIADKLDFYGTFSNLECGKHFSHIQLYMLNDYFDKSIELLEDFIKYPTFPENELKVLVQNEMQQFVLSREKPEVMASDEFIPRVFGPNHPYGRVRKLSDYEQIDLKAIKKFHQEFYHAQNCSIIVAGKLNGNVKQVLEASFGKNDWPGKKAKPAENGFQEPSAGRFTFHKNGAVQSSILIGNRTINKKHPDYFGLSILATILGGYFGSRLMTSLRERDALTYGVFSSLSSALHAGSLAISANVNPGFALKAIQTIYNEIDTLKTDLVNDLELDMVRNYLSGELLASLNGPLALSDIFLDINSYGLGFDFFKNYFDTLKSMNAETIRELANKYLVKESFVEIIAGNVQAIKT